MIHRSVLLLGFMYNTIEHLRAVLQSTMYRLILLQKMLQKFGDISSKLKIEKEVVNVL